VEHLPRLRRDDQQGVVAGAIIADKVQGKRVAVVHDKTTYGQGLAERRASDERKGIKEVLYEGVNVGHKDYSALVSKIKAAAPTSSIGRPARHGGLILRQLRDQGVKATSWSRWHHRRRIRADPGPGAEGTLMTFSPDRAPTRRTSKSSKSPQEGLRAAGLYALQLRAVQVIKQAAEEAKSLDQEVAR